MIINSEKLIIKIDGNYISSRNCIDSKCLDELIDRGLVRLVDTSNGNAPKYKISFVGFIEINDYIFISLPYGLKTEQLHSNDNYENIKNFIIKLIQSIRYFESHYSGKDQIVLSGRIAASFYLLEEFEDNGLLTKSVKRHSVQDKGKINWSKTINKSPVRKLNNSYFFTDFIRKKNIVHDNHEMTLIHKWAIYQSLKIISPISDEYNYELDDFKTYLTKNDVIEIANHLKAVVTKDRDTFILDLILQLTGDEGNHQLDAIYTKNFNLIWEAALQRTLEHDGKLKNEVPKVTWNDIEPVVKSFSIKKKRFSSSPSVDIIFKSSRGTHILDAKYYDLFNQGFRPGLTDLWKQFFYGQVYKSALDLEELPENGFLFPCFMNDNKRLVQKFSLVDFTVEQKDGKVTDLTNIPAYIVSIEKVLDAFVNKKSLKNNFIKECI